MYSFMAIDMSTAELFVTAFSLTKIYPSTLPIFYPSHLVRPNVTSSHKFSGISQCYFLLLKFGHYVYVEFTSINLKMRVKAETLIIIFLLSRNKQDTCHWLYIWHSSFGELLIVKNTVRNDSLWSKVVFFRKEQLFES